MRNTSFFVLIALFLLACQAPAPKTETKSEGESYGAGVSKPEAAIAFTDVIKQLDTADSINVVMKGKVVDVCQAKGCWMNIVDPASGDEDPVFVQFKDYGFFMPMDIAGREVILEGIAYKAETTVEELRHYAEDAGKSEAEIAAITEPLMERKFMASGVVLLPAKG